MRKFRLGMAFFISAIFTTIYYVWETDGGSNLIAADRWFWWVFLVLAMIAASCWNFLMFNMRMSRIVEDEIPESGGDGESIDWYRGGILYTRIMRRIEDEEE